MVRGDEGEVEVRLPAKDLRWLAKLLLRLGGEATVLALPGSPSWSRRKPRGPLRCIVRPFDGRTFLGLSAPQGALRPRRYAGWNDHDPHYVSPLWGGRHDPGGHPPVDPGPRRRRLLPLLLSRVPEHH